MGGGLEMVNFGDIVKSLKLHPVFFFFFSFFFAVVRFRRTSYSSWPEIIIYFAII